VKIELNKSIAYRPEIDGLRTIAVLPVILFHAGFSVFSGGYVGVDIFFVISGYLITSILLQELEAGNFSILRFYERRARRLMPALFFVIFACIPVAWFLMLPSELKLFGQSLVAVVTFSSNIYFWLTTNYFSVSAEELPLLHTWSLAVEEQFYLIFPLVLMFLWRQGRSLLMGIIVCFIITSIVLSEYSWRYYPVSNFYLLPTRAWELLMGAILAFPVFKNLCLSNSSANSILSSFGVVLIFYSIFMFDKATPFPSIYALVPVIGTCFIICFATDKCLTGRVLSSKPFVGIGLISYSAYLWHQPLFAFLKINSDKEPSLLLMFGLCFATLCLAYFSWRFIEAPFRQKNTISRNTLFALVFSGIGLTLIIGLMLHKWHNFKAHGTILEEFLNQKQSTAPNYGLPFPGCNAFDNKFELCNTSPKSKILLWGDSFAAHLTQIFEPDERGLMQATMSSCFPTSGLTPYEASGAYNQNWARACHEFANETLSYALASDDIKYVVISSTFYWPLNDGNSYDGKEFKQFSREDYLVALSEDIRLLREKGKKVVIVGPTPTSEGDSLKCAKRLMLAQPAGSALDQEQISHCDFEYPYSRVDSFLDELSILADVHIIDLRSVLCDDKNVCSVFVQGMPVYMDWGHLSPYGARRIQQVFDLRSDILATAR
jgi:peptidoglycan/LPS O-acetylase OafA/YrhL